MALELSVSMELAMIEAAWFTAEARLQVCWRGVKLWVGEAIEPGANHPQYAEPGSTADHVAGVV